MRHAELRKDEPGTARARGGAPGVLAPLARHGVSRAPHPAWPADRRRGVRATRRPARAAGRTRRRALVRRPPFESRSAAHRGRAVRRAGRRERGELRRGHPVAPRRGWRARARRRSASAGRARPRSGRARTPDARGGEWGFTSARCRSSGAPPVCASVQRRAAPRATRLCGGHPRRWIAASALRRTVARTVDDRHQPARRSGDRCSGARRRRAARRREPGAARARAPCRRGGARA